MNPALAPTGTDGAPARPTPAAMASVRADVPALARALREETRLLGLLRDVLDRQRAAVAEDDLPAVDQSVFDAQRILLSLTQARRRRRSLITLAAGEENLSLSSLPDVLGDALTPELSAALDEVLEVARVVAREMEMNRRILDGALVAGDAVLQALGRATRKPVYEAHARKARENGSGTNLLLNRQV